VAPHERTVAGHIILAVGAVLAVAALAWWTKGRISRREKQGGRRY